MQQPPAVVSEISPIFAIIPTNEVGSVKHNFVASTSQVRSSLSQSGTETETTPEIQDHMTHLAQKLQVSEIIPTTNIWPVAPTWCNETFGFTDGSKSCQHATKEGVVYSGIDHKKAWEQESAKIQHSTNDSQMEISKHRIRSSTARVEGSSDQSAKDVAIQSYLVPVFSSHRGSTASTLMKVVVILKQSLLEALETFKRPEKLIFQFFQSIGYRRKESLTVPRKKARDEDQHESRYISYIFKLSDNLLQQILKNIPFLDLIRSRTVCKKWNELIVSKSFAPRNPNPKPVLFHCRDALQNSSVLSSLSVFNMVTYRWEEIELAWMWNSYRLVATNAGLSVFYGFEDNEDVVIVSNLLTKAFRVLKIPTYRTMLPDLPRGAYFKNPYQYILVGLCVKEDTGTYILVVVGLHMNKRITMIFNSECGESGEWKLSTPIPRVWKESSSDRSKDPEGDKHWTCHGRCVVRSNSMYWYVRDTSEGSVVAKAVIKFDFQNEVWHMVMNPSEPCPVWHFQIATYKDSVMLIHMTHKDDSQWPLPDQNWPGKDELMELGPEMKLMPTDILDPIRAMQLSLGRNYCGEYHGVGYGEFLFHVMRGARPGVRVALQNINDQNYHLLPFWQDESYPRSETEIWLFTPAFRAFV